MPKLRHTNPLGYVDVPLLRRQGPAPRFVCDSCARVPDPDHEHTELVDQDGAQAGSGCLVPGEVFEVSAEVAKVLLEQADNYELVKPPAKKAAAKKAAAKPKPTAVPTNEKG